MVLGDLLIVDGVTAGYDGWWWGGVFEVVESMMVLNNWRVDERKMMFDDKMVSWSD